MQPSQLPYCIQIIQALGPTVVAIVIGLLAGYIAFKQWRTANSKLRMDMYDKRYAVYTATKDLIAKVTLHGQIIPEDIREFYSQIRGAEFLFDGSTRSFVMNIGDMCRRASATRILQQRQPDHPRVYALIDQEQAILEFLMDQDENLEANFRRYLDMTKVGL